MKTSIEIDEGRLKAIMGVVGLGTREEAVSCLRSGAVLVTVDGHVNGIAGLRLSERSTKRQFRHVREDFVTWGDFTRFVRGR